MVPPEGKGFQNRARVQPGVRRASWRRWPLVWTLKIKYNWGSRNTAGMLLLQIPALCPERKEGEAGMSLETPCAVTSTWWSSQESYPLMPMGNRVSESSGIPPHDPYPPTSMLWTQPHPILIYIHRTPFFFFFLSFSKDSQTWSGLHFLIKIADRCQA